MEIKEINCILEIDFLRNSSQKNVGVLRGPLLGLGCPKDTHPPYPYAAGG